MDDVITRLRSYDLTKTEALMILNLGIGLDRPAVPEQLSTAVPESESEPANPHPNREDEDEDEEDDKAMPTEPTPEPEPDLNAIPIPVTETTETAAADIQISETYHQYILARVVENIEERFPGEEGEKKIEDLLEILRECVPLIGGEGAGGDKGGGRGGA